MLALRSLSKRYGDVTAVDGLSLEARDGELLVGTRTLRWAGR